MIGICRGVGLALGSWLENNLVWVENALLVEN